MSPEVARGALTVREARRCFHEGTDGCSRPRGGWVEAGGQGAGGVRGEALRLRIKGDKGRWRIPPVTARERR